MCLTLLACPVDLDSSYNSLRSFQLVSASLEFLPTDTKGVQRCCCCKPYAHIFEV